MGHHSHPGRHSTPVEPPALPRIMSSSQELFACNVPAIILDCGSSNCRAGFSSDLQPKVVEPTIVARMRPNMTSTTKETLFVGEDALSKPRASFIKMYPVEWGVITNWSDIELVWHHLIYNRLQRNPEEHPVILLEEPLLPTANREKTVQIMFETFDVPALYLLKSPEASLMATGNRKTGLVIDIGGGSCLPTPVCEGYVLPRHIRKTVLNGQDLTYYLMSLLSKSNQSELTRETADQIKGQLCYVAQDYQEELSTFSCQQESQFPLPEGGSVCLGKERFMCPETIFQPLLRGEEMPGLHEIAYHTVMSCQEDLQDELFENIILTGGSALFPGLASRMKTEMQGLASRGRNVHVIASHDHHAAFKGTAMLAQQEEFWNRFLTKEFYDEYGPNRVIRQCF